MGGGASKVLDDVNPKKWIDQGIQQAQNEIKKAVIDPIVNVINSIGDEFNRVKDRLSNIDGAIGDLFYEVERTLKDFVDDAYAELKAPFEGIDSLIQDFQRMICWFNTLPTRIALVMSGIDHIFLGIGEQLDLYIQAFELGVDETGTLFNYSAVFLKSYLDCIEKFIVNLYKCFFYYIVDLLLKLMYLPVILILWIFSLFGFNGYKTERRFWNTMKKVDAFFYQNLKFHILEFPESVKNDCYRCTRLRKEVVDYQGNRLDYVFNEEMPKIVNGENSRKGLHTMKKGQRHFHEVNKLIPRNPNKVD